MTLKIDDTIVKYLMNNDFFNNVHPNVITSVGIICNILIIPYIYQINTKQINYEILAILFTVRWLADCLDGAIARKYNKKSKLGNQLDTLSDWMFQFIMFCALIMIFDLPSWTIIIFFALIYVEINKLDILNTHDNLKKDQDNVFNKMVKFTTDNSILLFIIMFIIIWSFNKTK